MRNRRAIAWICLGLALAALLELLPRPVHNVFWGVVYNAGHVPLFGVGSIVLLQLSKLLLAERIQRYRDHYYLALAGTIALGAASEFVQHLQPLRDADFWDLMRDALGAAIFLSVAATFDRQAREGLPWVAARPRLVRAIAALALVASFSEIALVTAAYRHRDRTFPILMTFDSWWETWFYEAHHGATSRRAAAPDAWVEHGAGQVLEVEFGKGNFPRLELTDLCPDWTAHRNLVIDVYSPNAQPLALGVKIRDRFLGDTRAERYERWFPIAPRSNRLVIPLEEIRTGAPARELNLATIRSLTLLLREQPTPVRLYFDQLRLE